MPKSEQFVIRDLGSRTERVSIGVPVDEQLLSHGDQIPLAVHCSLFLLRGKTNFISKGTRVELTETAEIGNSALST